MNVNALLFKLLDVTESSSLMEAIKLGYNEIFEATYERDAMAYQNASDVYTSIIELINSKEYIMQDDGNILIQGTDISPDYNDLYILLTPRNSINLNSDTHKSEYAIGTIGDRKVIICSILRAPGDDIKISGRLNKQNFMHEFTHYMDGKRYKGTPDGSAKTEFNISEYYNNPAEFNAYYQEASMFMFHHMFNNPDIMNIMKRKINSFVDFKRYAVKFLDKEFIENLNEKYMTKLNKRINTLYDKYLELVNINPDQT